MVIIRIYRLTIPLVHAVIVEPNEDVFSRTLLHLLDDHLAYDPIGWCGCASKPISGVGLSKFDQMYHGILNRNNFHELGEASLKPVRSAEDVTDVDFVASGSVHEKHYGTNL